jgi:hypothetical protein
MGPRRKADLDFLIAAQGHRRTRPFRRALAGFTLARRQNFTGHMTAGGALIRGQPRFASKRSDADDLLHPLLAPGTWNAISPLEKVRHRIAPSRNAHYSRKTRLRVKRFPLRSAIFALHHCGAHPALPGQAPVRRRDCAGSFSPPASRPHAPTTSCVLQSPQRVGDRWRNTGRSGQSSWSWA